MRGVVPGLRSPLPVASRLPGVYGDDEFMARFLSAFDEALAPVFLTLDDLACYVDPWLAPPDFLAWLAGWVGVELDDDWPEERSRETVATAAATQRLRGTTAGVAAAVRALTGGTVEVADSGGVTSSTTARPDADAATGPPTVRVRVTVPDPGSVDRPALEAAVSRLVPVHVQYSVDVVGGS